jgi:hypothetical protein
MTDHAACVVQKLEGEGSVLLRLSHQYAVGEDPAGQVGGVGCPRERGLGVT